jgi:hypothetical protein
MSSGVSIRVKKDEIAPGLAKSSRETDRWRVFRKPLSESPRIAQPFRAGAWPR